MCHIKGGTLWTKGAQDKECKIKIRAAGRNGSTILVDFRILGFWNRRPGKRIKDSVEIPPLTFLSSNRNDFQWLDRYDCFSDQASSAFANIMLFGYDRGLA
jgi:hypothetical protein